MSLNPTSPLTGVAITGLTNPTYSIADDVTENGYAKQWYVTALGGTQTGVNIHSISDPFTLRTQRPANLAAVKLNSAGLVLGTVPKNTFKSVVRKGVLVAVGSARREVATLRLLEDIPAGCEVADPLAVAAMYSFFGAFMTGKANDLYARAKTGSM